MVPHNTSTQQHQLTPMNKVISFAENTMRHSAQQNDAILRLSISQMEARVQLEHQKTLHGLQLELQRERDTARFRLAEAENKLAKMKTKYTTIKKQKSLRSPASSAAVYADADDDDYANASLFDDVLSTTPLSSEQTLANGSSVLLPAKPSNKRKTSGVDSHQARHRHAHGRKLRRVTEVNDNGLALTTLPASSKECISNKKARSTTGLSSSVRVNDIDDEDVDEEDDDDDDDDDVPSDPRDSLDASLTPLFFSIHADAPHPANLAALVHFVGEVSVPSMFSVPSQFLAVPISGLYKLFDLRHMLCDETNAMLRAGEEAFMAISVFLKGTCLWLTPSKQQQDQQQQHDELNSMDAQSLFIHSGFVVDTRKQDENRFNLRHLTQTLVTHCLLTQIFDSITDVEYDANFQKSKVMNEITLNTPMLHRLPYQPPQLTLVWGVSVKARDNEKKQGTWKACKGCDGAYGNIEKRDKSAIYKCAKHIPKKCCSCFLLHPRFQKQRADAINFNTPFTVDKEEVEKTIMTQIRVFDELFKRPHMRASIERRFQKFLFNGGVILPVTYADLLIRPDGRLYTLNTLKEAIGCIDNAGTSEKYHLPSARSLQEVCEKHSLDRKTARMILRQWHKMGLRRDMMIQNVFRVALDAAVAFSNNGTLHLQYTAMECYFQSKSVCHQSALPVSTTTTNALTNGSSISLFGINPMQFNGVQHHQQQQQFTGIMNHSSNNTIPQFQMATTTMSGDSPLVNLMNVYTRPTLTFDPNLDYSFIHAAPSQMTTTTTTMSGDSPLAKLINASTLSFDPNVDYSFIHTAPSQTTTTPFTTTATSTSVATPRVPEVQTRSDDAEIRVAEAIPKTVHYTPVNSTLSYAPLFEPKVGANAETEEEEWPSRDSTSSLFTGSLDNGIFGSGVTDADEMQYGDDEDHQNAAFWRRQDDYGTDTRFRLRF